MEASTDPFTRAQLAVSANATETLRGLLRDIDPTRGDSFLFRLAATLGHVDVARVLLEDGRVDPGARNQEALRHAIFVGRRDMLELLLAHPAVDPSVECSVRDRVNDEYVTGISPRLWGTYIVLEDAPLRVAVQAHTTHGLELLLADPRVVPTDTLLLMATELGRPEFVHMLLADGRVDPTMHDNEPLRCAHDGPNGPFPDHPWAELVAMLEGVQ